MKTRINSLDYLRGMSAIGIMLFHFFSWSYGEYNSQNIFSRVGLYGVSLFYILSGLTLSLVYLNKITSKFELLSFFIKRFARIMPLLWLVTAITILGSRHNFSVEIVLMNFTGLFGLLSPSSYIAGGAWSLGNEIVFYIFFPLLIFLFIRNNFYFHISAIIIFIVHLIFAFIILDRNQTIVAQWSTYINPFNQLTFFIGGIYIGLYKEKFKINEHLFFALLFLSLGILVFYPVYGNPINLVIGIPRLVFTLDCFLLTLIIFRLNSLSNKYFHQFLKWLGDVSYSLYLIHPIVWIITLKITHLFSFFDLSNSVIILLGVLLTLILSGLTYKYFEVPIIKFVNKRFTHFKS